jgi:SsrA-binding protein
MAIKLIATNKEAYRNYEILEKLECGIELKGSEVKSCRSGHAHVKESFARLENNEIFLYNSYISPYQEASYLNVESNRVRRLLLHKSQIRKFASHIILRGHALIPLSMYFNEKGTVKIELALCKGKKLYDRREDIKRKESDLHLRKTLIGRLKQK